MRATSPRLGRRRRAPRPAPLPNGSKMNTRRTVLERAYDLAKTGDCTGVTDIKARLEAEGYGAVEAELYGPTVSAALRRLCLAARNGQAAGGVTGVTTRQNRSWTPLPTGEGGKADHP
jgi:hypothetical protein